MTTEAPFQLRRIQILLNTLIGEHHVRGSLLREVCDLLGAAGRQLADAHRAALALLASLEGEVTSDEFDGEVQRISQIVASAPAAGSSVVGGRAVAA